MISFINNKFSCSRWLLWWWQLDQWLIKEIIIIIKTITIWNEWESESIIISFPSFITIMIHISSIKFQKKFHPFRFLIIDQWLSFWRKFCLVSGFFVCLRNNRLYDNQKTGLLFEKFPIEISSINIDHFEISFPFTNEWMDYLGKFLKQFFPKKKNNTIFDN